MLQTSRQLYAYWDRVRNERPAPRRFEIEPARIAPLLPETFIAACDGPFSYRFRLAGTQICEQFGRELRDTDVLDLWSDADREAAASLLHAVIRDAAVGYGRFRAYERGNRHARFEFLFLPLVHRGKSINRLLGAITAIDAPYWLGAEPLLRQEIVALNLHWPDGEPSLVERTTAQVIDLTGRRFRGVERRRAQ